MKLIAFSLIFLSQCVRSEIIAIQTPKGTGDRDDEIIKFWVNPCTGSISTEEKPIELLPCLKKSNSPSAIIAIKPNPKPKPTKPTPTPPSPTPKTPTPKTPTAQGPSKPSPEPTITLPIKTSSPTVQITKSPSAKPTSKPTPLPTSKPPTESPTKNFTEEITCPGEFCNFDKDGDGVIEVNFKYSVETTSAIKDINTRLDRIEENLLMKLAEKFLSHCLTEEDIRRSFSFEKVVERYRRRHLKVRRRLDTLGLCSRPEDKVLQEECEPQLDSSNNCFVLEGGVTLSIEIGDSEEETIKKVKEATKAIMNDDELLTNRNPQIKKVSYIEEDDNIGGVVVMEPSGRKNLLPIMLGSVFGLVALLLLVAVMKRRKKEIEHADPATGVPPYDGKNLGAVGLSTDVHVCTSASCPKCYVDNKILFFNSPKSQRPPSSRTSEQLKGMWGVPLGSSSSFESSSTTDFTQGKPLSCCT